AAQSTIQRINGDNRTWFAGAYLRNGFHEDGFHSAVQVAEKMETVFA
ncbi:MAG: cyclopropane-fatty-acyl-phospholipid synthase, partial [Pacificibacter sp.]